MTTKFKVYNKNPFNVGIRFMDNIREVSIPKNGFMMLEEDEIYFQHATCSLFKRGILTVDSPEINENMGLTSKPVVPLTNSQIETILKGSLVKIKKELSDVIEPHVKSKIFEVAKKMYSDLSGGKIDFIAELCDRDSEDLKPIKEEKVTKNKSGK